MTLVTRVMVDAQGPMAPVGFSLFTCLWLQKFEPATLETELATVASAYGRYVRFWGAVGENKPVSEDSWGDRTIDPQWPDYDAVVGAFFATAAKFNIRLMPTLIADPVLSMASASNRSAFIDRWARLIKGHEAQIQMVEIGNESEGKLPTSELLDLAKRLRSQIAPVLVTPTRGCSYYTDDTFPIATMHYERENDADGGEYAWIWRPYEYQYFECSHRPGTASNNEPKGPWSSGAAEFDPARLVLGHWSPFICGHAATVFHNGPGIRTGGAYDVNRGIPKHIAEIPQWAQIAEGLRQRALLCPPDLANYRLHNGHWASNPLDYGGNYPFDNGYLFRAATAENGVRFVAMAVRVQKDTIVKARQPMAFAEVDVLTGQPIRTFDLPTGGSFTLEAARPHALLIGNFKGGRKRSSRAAIEEAQRTVPDE